jgi:hypothetical protein
MIINGKWMNEPEIIALISQLTADKKRLERQLEQGAKRGYWKDVMMSEATGWDLSLTGGRDEVLETVCSVCGDCCAFGGDGDLYLSSYCPNCGADMRGTET